MKICIEGWRGINQSYALVNQWQLLELLQRPHVLRHRDLPWNSPDWNPIKNHGGFTQAQLQAIYGIQPPAPGEALDVLYRIGFPYDFRVTEPVPTWVFGTSEYQSLDGLHAHETLDQVRLDPRLRVVTPSQWSKVGFLKAGFSDEQVRVVAHGIDPQTFYPASAAERAHCRAQLGMAPEQFVISTVGAMTRGKGIDLLLVAFAILRQRYPHVRLLMKDQHNLYGVQGGQWLDYVRQQHPQGHRLTDEVRNSILLISQNLNLQQLRTVYLASDCYASPYRAEGFALTPLEAAACGVPVVLTRGGSTDDYFDPCLGLQIDSRLGPFGDGPPRWALEPDLDALVACLSQLIEGAVVVGGAQAAAYVHQHFSWRQAVDRLLAELAGSV